MGLTFAGVDIESTYGIIIDGASSWPKPERDVEYIHVPGRSGDILMDNGCWQNVEVSYNLCITGDWKTKFEDFAAWLCSHTGYFRLEDLERHPGVYRMASFAGPLDPELWFTTDTGVFTIVFNCKPQQWLLDGETEIVSPYTGMLSAKATKTDEGGGVYSYDVIEVQDELKHRTTTLYPVGAAAQGEVKLTLEEAFGGERLDVTVAIVPYDADKQIIQTQTVFPVFSTLTFWSFDTPGASQLYAYSFSSVSYLRIYVGTDDERTLSPFSAEFTVSSTGHPQTTVEAPIKWIDYPLSNPTGYESSPIINVDINSSVQVNDISVDVASGATFPVIIDGELETCYAEVDGEMVSMNPYVTITKTNPKELRDFPYLTAGVNRIHFDEPSLTDVYDADEYSTGTVSITPNWYRI